MKTLLVLPAMPEDSPFLKYYTDWYIENNNDFDVVCLNRKSYDTKKCSSNVIVYSQEIKYGENIIKRFVKNYLFCRFVRKRISEGEYDKIILFTLPIVVFLSFFLVRKYDKKYIIDIRDYSPIYRVEVCKWIIDRALRHSFANCISSVGFKSWLPKERSYVLSHNVGKDLLRLNESREFNSKSPIKILTIGLIRDFASNSELLNDLANKASFEFSFVGEGPDTPLLKEYVKMNHIENVVFYGRYEKQDEAVIVQGYDLINNYMPDNVLSNSLISNRFYLSVLYGKPMIVRKGSFQASLVNKYNLGIVVGPDDNMECAISSYCEEFNKDVFDLGRCSLLEEIKSDISLFESLLDEFVQ